MSIVPSRILLADDQADILQALRMLLGDAGFETDPANSVDAVLDHVAQRPYDLLLMDLNYTRDTTSGREGLDLLDRVRAASPALPIVVMTGWGSIETAVEAMRRGAKSFVQKPWDDATLVDVVRREVEDGQSAKRRDARHLRDEEEARLIQRALLPAAMPAMAGCDIAARWTPAAGIGGDCYDVVAFNDARAAVAIADVVGKGLPAALLMSNLQAAVRAFSADGTPPDAVVTSVNRLLCRNISAGKFVTFCYMVVDTRARTIAYCNAGHNPPLVMHANGEVERLAQTGLVLGVAPDWTYTTATLSLLPGDRIVAYTDGVTEALSADQREFGEERLIQTIRAHRTASAHDLVDCLSAAVNDWTGGVLQDDVTVVTLAVPGPAS
jgi:sigma-B regulation protein RsbU (phosphoserine phosphatase)